MGSEEDSNSIQIKIEDSTELTNVYRISNDSTTTDTSTLTAREFTFVGTDPAFGTGTLTSDATEVADGETVTIGSTVYRFKDTMAQAYDVKRNGTAAITLDNLKAAINASGTPGVEYYTGTLVHPNVNATTNADTSQVVSYNTESSASADIATTTTATHLSWGAATLSTGNDGSATISIGLDIFYKDITVSLKETGVSATVGTIYCEATLSGK